MSARLIPQLLTDDQKGHELQTLKQLLKIVPKFNQGQFTNIVSCNETWVYNLEPVKHWKRNVCKLNTKEDIKLPKGQ